MTLLFRSRSLGVVADREGLAFTCNKLCASVLDSCTKQDTKDKCQPELMWLRASGASISFSALPALGLLWAQPAACGLWLQGLIATYDTWRSLQQGLTSMSQGRKVSSTMMSYPYSSKQCRSLIMMFWQACTEVSFAGEACTMTLSRAALLSHALQVQQLQLAAGLAS